MIAVSVVVPTYNRCEVLQRTVRCLLEQTFAAEQYEVIVVDDQSTDDTWQWLQEAQAHDRPLIAVRNPKKGRGQARNAGLSAARGEIVCFVDDDVWVVPGFVQAHWEAHQRAGERAVVIGGLGHCPETKDTIANAYEDARLVRVEKRIQDAGEQLDAGFFRTGNVSAQRRFLTEIGGFSEAFQGYSYEDSELGYRLKAHGGRFVYAPQAAGVHFTEISIAAILRKSTEAGRSAVTFLRLWPEAAGPVPAPYAIPGIPATARHDSLLKRVNKAVLFSAPARAVMHGLLTGAMALGHRDASFRLLGALSYSYYSSAFRLAAKGTTELGTPVHTQVSTDT